MADYQTPTTELEAVNEMLRVIGESPVNTLDTDEPLPVDVAVAINALRFTSREVQTAGWHFNTEIEYPLALNVSGEAVVPANLLRIDTSGESAEFDVVVRGTRLYDRRAHSFAFTKPLEVQMVLLLPFTELPEAARLYITIRAARKFQAGQVGSQTLAGFTEQDEAGARALLLGAEASTENYNVFYDTSAIADLFNRS